MPKYVVYYNSIVHQNFTHQLYLWMLNYDQKAPTCTKLLLQWRGIIEQLKMIRNGDRGFGKKIFNNVEWQLQSIDL